MTANISSITRSQYKQGIDILGAVQSYLLPHTQIVSYLHFTQTQTTEQHPASYYAIISETNTEG